ncbi:MAG: carboxypeptidase-like regulatory domain-containing protein [Rubricoccaceae bacterium]
MFVAALAALCPASTLPLSPMARVLAFYLFLIPSLVFAQTQTVRGVVLDRDTQVPLIGANVVVVDSDPFLGAATDAEGRFELAGVPVGRHTLRAQYIGYESRALANVLVRSSQETVLVIELAEQVVDGEEVVVRGSTQQGEALNDMAAVSARSFSVEETRRYAGAVDDPARLVSAFAGVSTSGSGVQDNAVSIRGNAPKGVLWQLEGVPIPTPSHFAGLTVAGGGGLTLFSGQLLADSDVFTGAFPAEYGNALSGVFDMHFRTGNRATREHTIQLGLLGLEVASEGPITSGAPSTYLFNYRYSTLGLLMPLLPTDGATTYQDLAFKVAVPTRNAGRFEVWGLGGLDGQTLEANPDSAEWESEFWDRTRSDLSLGVGMGGVTHHLVIGTRSYLRTSMAATATRTEWMDDRLDDSIELRPNFRLRNTDARAILGTALHHKFSPRHVNRTGVRVQQLLYDLDLQAAPARQPPLVPVAGGDGSSTLVQAYTQSRVTPNAGLNVTLGLHAQHVALTEHTTIEPRVGLAWELPGGNAVSFGYGLHSQIDDLRIYLAQPDGGGQPNRTLGPSRAHHVVVGVSRAVSETVRIQLEGYAQRLFDVPVIADSSFSLLNLRQDWTFAEPLVNTGAGENLGVELTVERSLRNGVYGLATGSLFRSRYRGGDGVWRGSRYDQGYAVNLLAGREFALRSGNLFGANIRLAALGGERRSPVDDAASRQLEDVILDESQPFMERNPAIWLADLTLTYRRNGTRVAQVWALQLKNALAAKDTSFDYNYQRNRVEEIREGYPLPVLTYKLEF